MSFTLTAMRYFVEVQKRIDAATPEQVDAPEVSAPQYDTTAEVAAKIMAYLPEVCKWQDDGDRTNALILKFMQPANAYHGFNGSDFVELAGLIGFTIEKKLRDRITKYVHTFQAHRAISRPQQSGVYGDMYTKPRHDTMAGIYTIADAFMRRLLWLLERWSENQPATPAETPRISTETAETVNVSAEGEKVAETQETPRYECPNYADYAFERGWSIENTDFDAHSGVLCMIHFDPTDEKYVCGCLWQINSDGPNYTGHRRFKTLKGAQNYGTKRMGMKLKYQTLTVHCLIAPTEPPQSPEAPQTVERTTNTPKPRETARKRPNRSIGSKRTTRRDTLRDTLRPVTYVPRECSTADAAYW